MESAKQGVADDEGNEYGGNGRDKDSAIPFGLFRRYSDEAITHEI